MRSRPVARDERFLLRVEHPDCESYAERFYGGDATADARTRSPISRDRQIIVKFTYPLRY